MSDEFHSDAVSGPGKHDALARSMGWLGPDAPEATEQPASGPQDAARATDDATTDDEAAAGTAHATWLSALIAARHAEQEVDTSTDFDGGSRPDPRAADPESA